MALIAVGLSHKTAPVELRERLAISTDKLGDASARLLSEAGLKEAVLLSTCNRVEVYGRPSENSQTSLAAVTHFFETLYSHSGIASAVYRHHGVDAVRHLFRVTAGLDSLVVGETEILGQVKSAYQFAQMRESTGKITNVLFQRALYVGKLVRNQTPISEGASSVGSIAVQLASRIFGELRDHRILLIGAGEMAEVTARHLLSQKAGRLTILNRSVDRAQELARQFGGEAGALSDLTEELGRADIVLCSVTLDKPLITRAMMEPIMKSRRGRSLYFIDIAVPRNVEPDVHGLDNAFVYNIDDLRGIVEESLGRRRAAVESAEGMVDGLAREFYEWTEASLDGRSSALRHGALRPTAPEQ